MNQTAPLSAETISSAIFLFELLGAVALLVTIFQGILACVSFFRRPETIEKMLERYASADELKRVESDFKDDLKMLETRLGERFDGLHESLVEERKALAQVTQDLHRGVGRLEGANAVAEALKDGFKQAFLEAVREVNK